jgi:hypothetical protein
MGPEPMSRSKAHRAIPGQTRQVACDGKQRFDSYDLAMSVQDRRRRGDKLNAYRCMFCQGWHLGHHVSKKRVGR